MWIKASEPPKNDAEVFVCTVTKKGVKNFDKGYWMGDRWVHRGTSRVIWWMPIPEVPEEE